MGPILWAVVTGGGLAWASPGESCARACRVTDGSMECVLPAGRRWEVRVVSGEEPSPTLEAQADTGERLSCRSGEALRSLRVVLEEPSVELPGLAGILGFELGGPEVELDDVPWSAPSSSIGLGAGLRDGDGAWIGGGEAEELELAEPDREAEADELASP